LLEEFNDPVEEFLLAEQAVIETPIIFGTEEPTSLANNK
jgi:hypothetical protein